MQEMMQSHQSPRSNHGYYKDQLGQATPPMKFNPASEHDRGQPMQGHKQQLDSSSGSLSHQPSLWDATSDSSGKNVMRPQVEYCPNQN